jgi:hypothetical protein
MSKFGIKSINWIDEETLEVILWTSSTGFAERFCDDEDLEELKKWRTEIKKGKGESTFGANCDTTDGAGLVSGI